MTLNIFLNIHLLVHTSVFSLTHTYIKSYQPSKIVKHNKTST